MSNKTQKNTKIDQLFSASYSRWLIMGSYSSCWGKKNFFESAHWERRNCWNKSILSHFRCCLSLKRRFGGVSFLHDDDAVTTNEPLLLLGIDWPWMCWFVTAVAAAVVDVVVDDDDDGREKRCWWHGRPFRISTGTATRRGEEIVESMRSIKRIMKFGFSLVFTFIRSWTFHFVSI